MTATHDTDPDDSLEVLTQDANRENADLARAIETERVRRTAKAALKREAGQDSQEFRDRIESAMPRTTLDEVAAHSEETAEIERLDVLDALRQLQTGDPIRWKISRIGHDDPSMNGYLAEWTTSMLTQERIKNEFGGGTYRIRGAHSNGQYAGGRTIHIAGDAIRKERSTVTTQQSNTDIAGILAAQAAREAENRKAEDRRHEQERKDADEKEERRRRDRNELLAIVMPAITGLTTAIVGAFSANRGPDIATLIAAMKGPDPVTVLTQLKALEKGNSGNDALVAKLFPMLLDKLSDSGGGGSDTGWLDVAKELAKSAGPVVGGMIETAMRQVPQPQPAAPSLTQPLPGSLPMPMPSLAAPMASPAPTSSIVLPESVPRRERRQRIAHGSSAVESPDSPPGMSRPTPRDGSASTAVSNSPGTRGEDMNLLALMRYLPWMKEQLARMVAAAQRHRDPEVYAALFLEELPEGFDVRMLGELLSAPDWYQKLMQIDPNLSNADIHPWFLEVHRYIVMSLQQELAPAGGSPAGGSPAGSISQIAPAQPAAVPRSAPGRPTKIPSLTGED